MAIGSSPSLAYCTIFCHNIHRTSISISHLLIYIFAYVFMPANVCTCVRMHCMLQLRGFGRPPTQFSDLVSPVCWHVTVRHVIAAVFKLRAQFLNTCQGRHCRIKIDSAVNLGEKSSLEFRQCMLWVIQRTKTVSQFAVLFATLWHCRELSDKWYTPHFQWVLQRLTPAVTDRLPPVLTSPAVHSVCAIYHAMCQPANRLLLAASYTVFILCYNRFFPSCTCLYFS